MRVVKFRFDIGDILYTALHDKDGDLVITKGKVEYAYITDDGKTYSCTGWGNEVNENDTYSEADLIKSLPTLLKQSK